MKPVPATKRDIWQLDSAIIVVEFRAMRRANEISNFKKRNFSKRVQSQKNDQMATGYEISIESSGDFWADLVKVLDEFFEGRKFRDDDFVFQSAKNKGRKISTAGISQLVKRMIADTGIKGRFSSHSLWIGGATAAMMGGMSLEQIMSIGNWKSAAVNMYLHALGAAKAGMSKKMGFWLVSFCLNL